MEIKNKMIALMERFLYNGQRSERMDFGEELIEAFVLLDFDIGNPPFESQVENMIIC